MTPSLNESGGDASCKGVAEPAVLEPAALSRAQPQLQQLADQFARLVATTAAVPTGPVVASSGAEATPAPTAPAPASPVQTANFAAKGYHLEVTVGPRQVVAAAELLDRQGFALDTITGVDWLAAQQMEVVYDYFHPSAPWRVVVRTRLARLQPELPTISTVFPGANWHEREAHDFFGIVFQGHPQLEPLLLPEDATYHPLRKDFQA
jgi:NADH-quinone oxidoreductase subunit C